MTGGSAIEPLPLLLLLMGCASAGLHLWPSIHTALSNASVFVEYNTDSNSTGQALTVHLVDIDKNVTILTRLIPFNKSEGSLEFDCSCFLYAGNFRFKMEQIIDLDAQNRTAILWWSPVLHVEWPTFHISVERGSNNRSSNAFQIGVSTNDNFYACSSSRPAGLYLEVSYLEHNQIGRRVIDKVRDRTRHDMKLVKSQQVELDCAFYLTERDFIQVALKSLHTQQDIKSSRPLYLARIFSYKLLVDNLYKDGCEGSVAVRLVTPPCALASGKVLLYREGSKASSGTAAAPEESPPQPHLAYNWLTQGENETEFNCSVFDHGRNKYCFRFVLIYSQALSPAQTCVIVQRNSETWGPWQPWGSCSVTCGEGVRERVRECLVPSGGGMRCTGMVREQSHCSLEDCTDLSPAPSVTPPPAVMSPLGGNLVVVAGISLCLAIILATVLVTIWRKLCRAPKCNSVRRTSMHSPGGRKNSDEASICGHSLQRPSLSESLQATPIQRGLTLPTRGATSKRAQLGRLQSLSLPLPLALPQDPERSSPSGQKIMPPIFGYRLAQQQLKEMKKKGLKEATQVYHVSHSPVDDTLLETATASTPAGHTPVPQDADGRDADANAGRFRVQPPFQDATTWMPKSSATLPDRLSPKVDLLLGPPVSGYGSRRHDRTADWVEMVERSGLGYSRNPNFRRTSSFHDSTQLQQLAQARPFRERSLTQVTPRQLPEGSCRTRAWEQPIPELEDWSRPKDRATDCSADHRRRPWIETTPPRAEPKHSLTAAVAKLRTESIGKGDPVSGQRAVGRRPSLVLDRAERAEQNWSRRGPSPIQRTILARKLREAGSSSATGQRQRSSTFSSSGQRRGRCRSLPLSADYSGAPFCLSEAEQRMMDLSGYLGEEEGVEVVDVHRLS